MALRPTLYCGNFISKMLHLSKQRCIQIPMSRYITVTAPRLDKDEVNVTFVKNGKKFQVKGKLGDNLLDLVINNNLEFDGFGACDGTLTCSTCHVILKQEDYDKLPDKPSEDECDMLDLAFEVTDTSRLGCQVVLTKELDGLEVRVPDTVNDIRNAR